MNVLLDRPLTVTIETEEDIFPYLRNVTQAYVNNIFPAEAIRINFPLHLTDKVLKTAVSILFPTNTRPTVALSNYPDWYPLMKINTLLTEQVYDDSMKCYPQNKIIWYAYHQDGVDFATEQKAVRDAPRIYSPIIANYDDCWMPVNVFSDYEPIIEYIHNMYRELWGYMHSYYPNLKKYVEALGPTPIGIVRLSI